MEGWDATQGSLAWGHLWSKIDGIHGRPVGGGREGADSFFGRLKACVDFTPYINSWLISTHFR
jgi:hypothetical protein